MAPRSGGSQRFEEFSNAGFWTMWVNARHGINTLTNRAIIEGSLLLVNQFTLRTSAPVIITRMTGKMRMKMSKGEKATTMMRCRKLQTLSIVYMTWSSSHSDQNAPIRILTTQPTPRENELLLSLIRSSQLTKKIQSAIRLKRI